MLNNLAYMTSDDADSKLGNSLPPDNIELTLRMARGYLKDGPQPEVKEKIRHYFRLLFPARYGSQKQSSLRFPFEATAHAEATPVRFEAAGTEHTITYSDGIDAIPNLTEMLRLSIEDSYRVYGSLSGAQLKPVRASLHTIPFREDGEEYAAEAGLSEDESVCEVNLWRGFLRNYYADPAPTSAVKQILAHELFHCVQGAAFRDVLQGANAAYNDWSVEGGAEYFSNVVYPTYNLENQYNGGFDARSKNTELYKMSYEAYIFHMFLGGRVGNEALWSFYKTLPTRGGYDAERRALSGFANIDELFHDFGKEYLSNSLIDTSGRPKRFSPSFGSIDTITADARLNYETRPFILYRFTKDYQHHGGFFLVETNDEGGIGGRYSVRLKSGEGIWRHMPDRVPIAGEGAAGTASCDTSNASTKYVVLQTSTEASSGEYQLHFDIEANGTDPLPGDTRADTIDQRLVGRWTVDEASARRALDGLLAHYNPGAGNVTIEEFDYDATMCFRSDGSYYSDFLYKAGYGINIPGGSVAATLSLANSNAANYEVYDNGRIISFTNIRENILGRITSTSSFGSATTPLAQDFSSAAQLEILNDILSRNPPQTPEDFDAVEALKRRIIPRNISAEASPEYYDTSYRISGSTATFRLPIEPYPELTIRKVD